MVDRCAFSLSGRCLRPCSRCCSCMELSVVRIKCGTPCRTAGTVGRVWPAAEAVVWIFQLSPHGPIRNSRGRSHGNAAVVRGRPPYFYHESLARAWRPLRGWFAFRRRVAGDYGNSGKSGARKPPLYSRAGVARRAGYHRRRDRRLVLNSMSAGTEPRTPNAERQTPSASQYSWIAQNIPFERRIDVRGINRRDSMSIH